MQVVILWLLPCLSKASDYFNPELLRIYYFANKSKNSGSK